MNAATHRNESPLDLAALAARELSLKARLGYVLLLLVSTGMTVALVSLLLTEPALPLRTTTAFACMSAIGLSWASFSLWMLGSRRILLAADALIAARMALVFSGVFFLGALAVIVSTGKGAAWGAAGGGVVMMVVAGMMLRRARRQHAALLARQAELQRQLRGDGA